MSTDANSSQFDSVAGPILSANVKFYDNNQKYKNMLEEHRTNEVWFQDYYHNILANTTPNSIILDCGCGTGVTTSYLYQSRPHVQGVDFSSLFIEEALKHGDYFSIMDMSKLEFPSAHFDLVCSADAIEHTMDAEGALSEMIRVLKPGGYLVLQAPNLSCGLISTNYKKTPSAVLRRAYYLIHDYFSNRLKTILNFKLETMYGDKDAYNLISPIWLSRFLIKRGFRIQYISTFALYFKPGLTLRITTRILQKLPIARHIGGRIIVAARKC